MSITSKQTKHEIRRRLRKKRRALPAAERRRADNAICRRLLRLPVFRRADKIALFHAFDGEPSLAELINFCEAGSKQFFIPVIHNRNMRFVQVRDKDKLRPNAFGIAEPVRGVSCSTRLLDLVLVPLVGFDRAGNRLGMGGGFYDRRFAYLKTRSTFRRPKLLGVAYNIQEVPQLPVESWDIPLWGVVTDRDVHFF
jgi:5-formyltetrahydrofolate cyclo-ligase